jgi:hypothetical protein
MRSQAKLARVIVWETMPEVSNLSTVAPGAGLRTSVVGQRLRHAEVVRVTRGFFSAESQFRLFDPLGRAMPCRTEAIARLISLIGLIFLGRVFMQAMISTGDRQLCHGQPPIDERVLETEIGFIKVFKWRSGTPDSGPPIKPAGLRAIADPENLPTVESHLKSAYDRQAALYALVRSKGVSTFSSPSERRCIVYPVIFQGHRIHQILHRKR